MKEDSVKIIIGCVVFLMFIILLMVIVTMDNTHLVDARNARVICEELLGNHQNAPQKWSTSNECRLHLLQTNNITEQKATAFYEYIDVKVITSCQSFIEEYDGKFKNDMQLDNCVKILKEDPYITKLEMIDIFKEIWRDGFNVPVLKAVEDPTN